MVCVGIFWLWGLGSDDLLTLYMLVDKAFGHQVIEENYKSNFNLVLASGKICLQSTIASF